MLPAASLAVMILLGAAPAVAGAGGESVGAVVAPAARDPGLRVEAPSALSSLDWSDPEALRPRGLGDGPARRPVERFETALCELSSDPRLAADSLLSEAPELATDPAPDPVGTHAPEEPPAAAACGGLLTDGGTAAFRGGVRPSADTAPDHWAVTPSDPAELASSASGHPVSPLAWGELSNPPGLIQQPAATMRARGDKVRYPLLKDTTLGFDGHVLRLRLSYPRLDPP